MNCFQEVCEIQKGTPHIGRIQKCRITKHRFTKRLQDKTLTLQNIDYNKTSTTTKHRQIFFVTK
jgi:hypothetical protein